MRNDNQLVSDVSININVPPLPASGDGSECYEDNGGRLRKTGTVLKGSVFIMSTMIGPGALALPFAFAQFGWIAGVVVMFFFSFVAYYTFYIQTNGGARNYTYADVVKADLGGFRAKLFGAVVFLNRFGMPIGYTIMSSDSMMAIQNSICFQLNGTTSSCKASSNPFMIAFGLIQMILSQYPNFYKIPVVSIVSAVMPITYTSIALGLQIARVAENGIIKGSYRVGVVTDQTQKIWTTLLLALGSINFAFSYTLSLIEIQGVIKSEASESEKVKKSGLICVLISSSLKMLCAISGYAAFGDASQVNLLTGFGFYNPYWLVDIANVAVVVHLTVAFQVFCQPLFVSVEEIAQELFPHSKFTQKPGHFDLFRSVWRSIFVIFVTALAMLVPHFNYVVGILGVLRFWLLTVYFPVQIHIAQKEIRRWRWKWFGLQLFSSACCIVSVAAAAASIAGIVSLL